MQLTTFSADSAVSRTIRNLKADLASAVGKN